MIDASALKSWLNSTNARYRAEDVPPRHRPFRALSDFSGEFKCSVSFESPIAKSILEWFYKHSSPGSHAIGALFTGAFYFDACFWPLFIPIEFGTFSINALDCLETMPQPIKEHFNQSRQDSRDLNLHWLDCCDYGYGIDDIRKMNKLSERALAFIVNGDRELAGAIAQLILPRPNTKAILALRMICEIFLKVLLIQERNFTDKQLMKLGHKIEDIAAECFTITGVPEFDIISNTKGIFPEVSDRYNGVERKLPEVWKALRITQIAATAVIRKYTDRDMRAKIFR